MSDRIECAPINTHVDVGKVDDPGTEITDTTGRDWNAPSQELRATEPDADAEQGKASAEESGQPAASWEPRANQA